MDGTISSRVEGAKKKYPRALPVFEVRSESEARRLIALACTMSQDGSGRMGIPHFDEWSPSIDPVGAIQKARERLAAFYRYMEK